MLCSARNISSADATSFLFQVKTVVQRENMSLWRNPGYIFSRLFIATFISLFISLSQLQLGNSVRDLQLRIFGIFFVAILPAVVISQLEPVFIFKRSIFNRGSCYLAHSSKRHTNCFFRGLFQDLLSLGVCPWTDS